MNQDGGQAKLADYEVLEAIGTGCFGTVSKIQRKSDGKVCAECACSGRQI